MNNRDAWGNFSNSKRHDHSAVCRKCKGFIEFKQVMRNNRLKWVPVNQDGTPHKCK